jgi:hypothetical protein
MPESDNVYLQRGSMIAGRAAELAKTRRGRRIGITVLVLLLIFTIGGFVVVPHVLRGILTGQVATSLHRPVTVGTIRFNPYTLRLQVNDLRVAGHGDEKPLAAFAHLDLKAGWSSLFRIKPIVKEVTLDEPAINVVRKADGTFNFSDLLVPSAAPTPQAPSKPLKFQVSNIRIHDGDVTFDDEKVGSHHEIKELELAVPFIANLPGKIDYVVQPLLKMNVDGSLVRVQGASRPFAGTRDSAFSLTFHRIDLPQFISYLPPSMALKLPSGALSIDLLLHFRQADTGPSIVLNGAVAVDQLDVRDSSNAPVLAIDHGEVKVDQLGPLDRVVDLSEIALIGLKANLVRGQDGALNVATMLGAPPARKAEAAAASKVAAATHKVEAAAAPATPAPAPATAAQPAETQEESPAFDVVVDSIKIIDSAATYTDLSAGSPANVALDGLNAGVEHLRLSGQLPADYQVAANVHTGGTVTVKGTLQLPKSDATAEVALDQIDLPSLQAFAQSVFAGTLSSGKLSAHGTLQTHFASDQFNLHAEPADLAIDNLAIKQARMKDPPVAWTRFGVTLDKFDLASRQVTVKEVRSDGIKLFVQRSKGGQLSLTELIKKPAPPAAESRRKVSPRTEREERGVAKPAAEPPAPPWHYQVQSIALENTDARFADYATPKVVRAQFAPLNIHLKDVTDDFAKPFGVQVDGVRNRRGTFKIDGTAAIDPLNTELRVETKNLDLAAINNYVSTRLNAQLTSAELTMKAQAGVQKIKEDYHVKYRGDLALNNVATIDKLTGDNFVDWKSLSIRGVDAAVGEGEPKVHLASIALKNFDGRVILDSAGKLNLSNIVAQPSEAPKSLTRENVQGAAPAPTAAPAPAAAATAAAHPMNADIMVDKVTLEGGHVFYTDDFIKPNYSADLTQITGSIGAFGTSTQQPADVELQGQVNGNAPLNISGSINPLTPLASVDIKAKAQGIELTQLSAYSTKYTGYPITKGSLNVDVHYLLNQGTLTANNHLFIDQLTFGDRVENSSARNLPVRLAVAILKNSRGEIDLNIPVSGSLSDPQFSLGSVIWSAFMNVLTKAITAPFSLLASAVGAIAGGGGSGDTGSSQDLSFVPFKPGLATLTGNAKNGLTTLGNALRDRPALHLSICGRVDPDKDLEGLREAWVDDQVRAQKARDIGKDPESVQVTQGDYDKYLERAYRKAKIPKPRNFVGLAQDLPRDQMKKLMIEHAPVSKDDLPKLADGRAAVVKQYLVATVPADRLSVVAPKLNADGIKDGPTTRADLGLH